LSACWLPRNPALRQELRVKVAQSQPVSAEA
jgi:hypothetical protein